MRLPIDRAFSVRGFGTVVTGTLTSGRLEVDRELVLLPDATRVKVRGLQVYGAARQTVEAGRRVAVNLGGVNIEAVRRGQTLTTEEAFDPTRRFDAVLTLLEDSRPLRHGARVRFHQGTVEILGRVALAWRGDDGLASELRPGQSAFVRVRLEAPAVLTRGDRFILRSYSPSVTIGGGSVLDPTPARTPIRTAAAGARFRRLSGDARGAALVFIEERGVAGLAIDRLGRRLGVSGDAALMLANSLSTSGDVVAVGDLLFSAALVASVRMRLVEAVELHHRNAPASEGLPREEARERVMRTGAPSLFAHLVAALSSEGTIVGRDRLSLPGRVPSVTPEESQRAGRARRTVPRRGSGASGSARGRSAGADPAIGRRARVTTPDS